MEYLRVRKETECCSTEDMNTCIIVFKMELLFGDADITGLLLRFIPRALYSKCALFHVRFFPVRLFPVRLFPVRFFS